MRALPRIFLAAAYVIVVIAPLVAVAVEIRPPLMPDARQALLLGRSILFSGAVAILTTAVATSAALPLSTRAASWLPLIVPVPPALYAAAWAAALSLAVPGLADGWAAATVVQVVSLLPLATALVWVALRAVPGDLLDAARLLGPDPTRAVLLPLAAGGLGAAAGLVFLLSLLDYETPSLFRVHVYAMEVFVAYGASPGRGLSAAVTTAIPLVAVAGLVAIPALSSLRRLSLPAASPAPLQARPIALLPFCAALLPVVLLAAAARSAHLPTGAWDDLLRSVGTSIAAALACLPLAWGAARAIRQRPSLAWPAIVLPLTVPPSLIGLGLLTVLNNPLTQGVLDSSAAFVLADLARFTPVAALVLHTAWLRSDPALLDAATLLQRNDLHGLIRVRLPLALPALGAAAALTFALSVAELPAAVLVAPPGAATLPLRLYNLLHYGATPDVAALALLLLAACLMAGVALQLAWRGIR